jgi:hypothetical protein
MSFRALDKEHVEALKCSLKVVGPLQPIIVNKRNRKVLVGRHRLEASAKWPVNEVDVGPMEEDLITLCGDKTRVVKEEEIKHIMLRIANRLFLEQKIPQEKVCSRMTRMLKGMYTDRQIRVYLPPEFKMQSKKRKKICGGASAKSALSKKLDKVGRKVKSALDVDSPTTYSFDDCLCKKCNHKENCGHPPDTQ